MKAILFILVTLSLTGCAGTSAPLITQPLTSQPQLELQAPKESTNRKLIVFMDGTGNTVKSSTNIYKMYKLAEEHAKQGHNIVPHYLEGVGTNQWYTKIVGGAFGDGLSKKIRAGYQFLVANYQEGDEIFIFGFSRGAYSARSLNGLIEFAGLIDINKIDEKNLKQEVKSIFNSYHTLNTGTPNFERQLRYDLKQKYAAKIVDHKVVVTAIGVYDTVAALGLSRDDFPDDHRTNLYANEGYHALSLDEQRHDFKLLRFDDYNLQSKTLKEVWFPGVHADVGGGYDDSDELDSISRLWMLQQFKKHNLFAEEQSPSKCSESQSCYKGKLHDAFFDSKLFGRLGISRRRPRPLDHIHQSIVCRMNIATLPQPHPKREIIKKRNPKTTFKEYKPFNLKHPVNESYTLESKDQYQCSNEVAVQ